MKLILKAGLTSQLARVFLQDSSSSTGAGLTGLAFNSSGLKWSFIREDQSTATVVTPATATVGTWATGGFKEIDATNLPGVYEVGVPNAALASGKSVQMLIFGATNLVPCPVEIELVAVDVQSATGFVASVPAVVGAVGSVTGAVGSVTGGVGGSVTGSVGSVVGGVGGSVTGSVGSVAGGVGGNIAGSVASVVGAVTLPTIPTDWIAAAGLKADAVTKIQAGLSTYAGADTSGTTTLLARLTSARAGYLDNISAGPVALATTALSTAVWTAQKAGFLDAAVSSATAPTAAVVAAAVWDLTTSGHTTSGTFGSAMNAAGSAGDPWGTALPGAYGAGSAGFILGTNLNATVSSRMATFTLPTNFPSLGITAGGKISGVVLVDACTANTDMRGTDSAATAASLATLTTTVGAAGAGLSAIPKTGFKLASDGLDAVSATDPTGVPSTFREKLLWLYRRMARSTLTASTLTVKGSGGATITGQTVSDDGTTQTVGEPS